MSWLQQQFEHIEHGQWLIALAVLLGILLVLRLAQSLVRRKLSRLAEKTETRWDDYVVDAVGATRLLFLLIVSVFGASLTLNLDDNVDATIQSITAIAVIIQGGLWISAVLRGVIHNHRDNAVESDRAQLSTISLIGFLLRLALWVTVLLLVLDNLGINITALVAGLGIGGVAVALALQNILGDLFASLSIVLDKPFVVGDFLVVGDLMGSVEYVGIKTTRLRSLSGEQLVFSNSDLLSSRIRNYGRMAERRISFSLGVVYQTPREKLQRIPGLIRQAVEEQHIARFDRSHFSAYGDFSLNFETVYYVLSADYAEYMDVQQAIYFRIHELFEAEEVEFAYPTQTLFVNRTDAAEPG